MSVILSSTALSVGHGGKVLLSDMSLELHRGELTVLFGRNGAGKSTLLSVLTRSSRPMSGEVRLGDLPINDYSAAEWSRLMAIVTTDRVMVGALTVCEVVSLGRQPYTGVLGRLSDDDRDIVMASLSAVGMADYSDRYFATLSDGERQKAMIARALAQHTPIIVLDEPTAFLDVASKIEIMQLLRDIARQRDIAVLMSSHDAGQALPVADTLWIITTDGTLISGTASEVIAAGVMDRVFPNPNIRFDRVRQDYYLV